MDAKNTISVVIPIFNEEHTILELYNSLFPVLSKLNYAYEIIFVDDGSHDNSFNILSDLTKKDSNVRIIKFSRNFGQQSAYAAGIAHVSGKAAILMDGDLEDPPGLIPDMIKLWEEGNKVVYTIKISRKEGFIMRVLFNSFYKILKFMAQESLPYGAGIFSLIDRDVIKVLNSMPEKNKYLSGLRAYAGFRQVGIKFNSQKRHFGKPRQSFVRHLRLALNAIFSFSYLPLRMATLFGFLIGALGFIMSLIIVIHRIIKGSIVQGWASIISVVLIVGAVQLISLGIVGEYILRIFDAVKQRPEYIIENKVGF
jgi:dolichol-phosphate mannosyltransferase